MGLSLAHEMANYFIRLILDLHNYLFAFVTLDRACSLHPQINYQSILCHLSYLEICMSHTAKSQHLRCKIWHMVKKQAGA